jgi:ornithine carbamoyltransferase
MKLKTKNLLTLEELEPKEISSIIDLGIKFKKELKKGIHKPILKNKTLVMIFQKPSTRTRVSFEIGMFQLGGYALNLSSNDMQLSRGETLEDTSRTLSLYANAIMARVYDHKTIETLGKYSSIPVINGLSNSFHPCQILADLMTIKEKKKKLDGLKVAWIGDGNNVCNSLIYGCSKVGIDLSIATPTGFTPDSKVVRDSKKHIDIELTNNPITSVKNADVIMTDTYESIHNKDSTRIKKFLPKFQVNSSLMKKAKKDSIFLHCLPAKRGNEVTNSVIDGPQSAVWDQAENRLHTQKALLVSLMSI